MRIALKNRYEILEASTGEDALAAAAADDVRLILLDVMMPGMTGHEVSRRLRRNPLTCHIIIVMLTSQDSETDIIEGLKSGADDYIVKPPKIPEMLARLDSHLRRQWRELRANPLTGLPGNNEIDQVIRRAWGLAISSALRRRVMFIVREVGRSALRWGYALRRRAMCSLKWRQPLLFA